MAPEGQSRLATAAGAEPSGEMRDEELHSQNVQSTSLLEHFWKLMLKKCTLLWREAHVEVKMHKARDSRITWKLRCSKSARCCGTKHILKSKCTKHTVLGIFVEVEMLKKCTPWWREANFQVKMLKTPHVCATFGR